MLSDSAIDTSVRLTKRRRLVETTDTPLYQIPGPRFGQYPPESGVREGLDIEPYEPERLNPSSYDLTLSPIVLTMHRSLRYIDVGAMSDRYTERYDMRQDESQACWLEPGAFVLAATNEVVSVPDTLVARVEGKSSLGRLGLAVHITAGFIDPGFKGSITLEIANLNVVPIVLRQDMRIAQIAFQPVVGAVAKPYSITGHYQDQPAGEPVESRYRL